MKQWMLVAALAALALPSAAGADLLRCKGPDGKMIYTDNKALCPGAEPFEPEGEVQRGKSGPHGSESASSSGASRRDMLAERMRRAQQRQAAFEAQEGEAERWRRKKEKLEKDIEDLDQRREYLEKFITNCNRGGLVYGRDASGIKRKIRCDEIEEEYATLGSRQEEAHARLAELPEECRKAGCLPGWLRD
jgi:hypothetical protein